MTTHDRGRNPNDFTRGSPASELGLVAAMLAISIPGHAAATGSDYCKAVTTAVVAQALHTPIVRAEAPLSEVGCEYSAKGTPANAASNHTVAMIGALGGAQMDPQAAKAISSFGNAVLGGASAKEQKQERHPGEIAVLAFTVSEGNAQQEMKINRDMMARMSQVTTVPDLGDDAFESSGSVLMVRKGDKFIHFIYTQCSCSSADIIPLAKQIVAGL